MKAAKKTKPETYDSLTDNLVKMNELTGKIDKTKSEISHVRSWCQKYSRDLIGLRQAVNSYRSTVDGLQRNGHRRPYYQEKLRIAEREFDSTNQEHEKNTQLLNKLQEQLKQLEEEYAALCQGASIHHVLVHQEHIKNSEEKVAGLKTLIAEQEESASLASGDHDPLDDLMVEREALLARIYLGESDKKELTVLDEKIAKVDEGYKKEQVQQMDVLRHSRQTVAGLQRRLEDEEAELDRLNGLTPQVIEQFLITEAEQLAGEYQNLAQSIIGTVKRLAALDKMATDIGQHMEAVFLHSQWRQTFLPKTLIGEQAETTSNNAPPGALFAMQFSQFLIDSQIAEEVAQMTKQGINYPGQSGV